MIQQRTCSFDGPDCSCRVRYEPRSDEPPSIAAATALARYHDEDVTNATTLLYDYVDPEAIDALLADRGPNRPSTTIEIEAEDLCMRISATCVTVEHPE